MKAQLIMSLIALNVLQACAKSNEATFCSKTTTMNVNIDTGEFNIVFRDEKESIESYVDRCDISGLTCFIEPFPFIDPKIFDLEEKSLVKLEKVTFELIEQNNKSFVIKSYYNNENGKNSYFLIYYSKLHGIGEIRTYVGVKFERFLACGGRLKVERKGLS
jgi:hypothetical protein